MESAGKILNDNEKFKLTPNNDNVGKVDDEFAEGLADYIQYKLGATDDSRKYFLKVAYKLPHGFIDRTLVYAVEKGKSPIKLFIYLTKKEMVRRYGKDS